MVSSNMLKDILRFFLLSIFKEANDELEAVLMNRSLEQGKAVLSQTNREGTSIEMELRNMDDNQVRHLLHFHY